MRCLERDLATGMNGRQRYLIGWFRLCIDVIYQYILDLQNRTISWATAATSAIRRPRHMAVVQSNFF